MDTKNLFRFKSFHLQCIIITVFSIIANQVLSLDPKFDACAPKSCNGLTIKYPFWISGEQEPSCGYPNFEISCDDKTPVLTISDDDYIIKDIFYANSSLLVANYAAYEESCPIPLHNLTLDRTPFNLISTYPYLFFLYNCTKNPPQYVTYPINCASNSTHHSFTGIHMDVLVNANYSIELCQSLIYAPVHLENGVDIENLERTNYAEILKRGLLLNWTAHNCSNCEQSGGRCGFNNNDFVCFCGDRPHMKTCDDGDKKNVRLKLKIGFGAAFGGMGIMAAIFLIYLRWYKKKNSSSIFSHKTSSDPSSTEDLEKGDNFLGVHVFAYAELEEATNNFDSAKELGDGGFGSVHYGELQDGRAVAVKRLYENNYRRVEQFMNEVEILAHLRHQNLVSLYGCTSRHSRELLLVYEYIPNGTVADHLHGARAKPGEPSWPTRLKIAIDTAKALTYLHASDIIHRDVKTNNILLDNNFCVKVADFGLSRLFPNHVTHVSTAPQGTPGYVDPEYHQCYQLTDKSDVFSFGVVLIELISSMPAVDISRHRHEINLSNLAINKIQNKALHELVDSTLGYESDYNIRKMINAVAELAFQCLQSEKDMRPYMADVLETLKDIQNGGYNKAKEEEMDIPLEDVKFLKSGTPEYSSDSEFCRSKLDHRKNKTNAIN